MAAGYAASVHLQMNSQNSEVKNLNLIDFRHPVSKHSVNICNYEASIYKA